MAEYKYTPADFKSDQEVRWCPGCGDHAILNAVQRALPEIADATDTPHNMFTFVSGIGCSSRFIYYMKTYGFHSVHGRANAVATGVKVANPRLNVWVTTGDGDSLAIGGNHFIHAIRRNVDLNVILFNNEIYGLTKGQYSPTSKLGKITKTSPYGTVEKPFNPGELVIGAKGTFFARSVDMEVGLSKECMVAAAMHKGMSVVEVLQNCVIFNDKTHGEFAADKATRAERTVTLRHGEKMLFGADKQKGIVFENMKLKVVTVGEDGYTLDDVLTHDAHQRDAPLDAGGDEVPRLPRRLGCNPGRRGRHGLRPRGRPAGRGGQSPEQNPLGGRVAAFGRDLGDRVTEECADGRPDHGKLRDESLRGRKTAPRAGRSRKCVRRPSPEGQSDIRQDANAEGSLFRKGVNPVRMLSLKIRYSSIRNSRKFRLFLISEHISRFRQSKRRIRWFRQQAYG